MTTHRPEITRTTLAIICILVLITGSLWVLRPFLAATVWATMLVVATWPLMRTLQEKFRGRRLPAVLLMLSGMVLLLAIPLWLVTSIILDHAAEVAEVGRKLSASGVPAPPEWLQQLPLVGAKLAALWLQWSAAGADGLIAKATPHASAAAGWVLGQLGTIGGMIIHFLLVLGLSALMYFQGEIAANSVRRFAHRLADQRGENMVTLAGQAIRGVALGVGVTAIVQTLLGAIGLALAGVPFTALLTIIMLVFCIAQIGPGLVLFPAVGWLYWTGDHGWGTFLLVWSVVVVTLDNVLRPYLIKKGADLPLLLIFAGVVGGLLSFGLIGIFIGPVVLAVTYTLLEAWIEDKLGKADDMADDEP